MTKSVIQLHADPKELCGFVSEVAKEMNLWISGIWGGHGFGVVPKAEGLPGLVAAQGVPSWLFITEKEPAKGDYRATQDFLRANPGALSVHVGHLSQEGLDESSMGFLTADEGAARRWRRVIDRLKRRTHMGAKATNVGTGLSGDAKSHRYTEAALDLARKGVTMWALGRKTVLEFPARKEA